MLIIPNKAWFTCGRWSLRNIVSLCLLFHWLGVEIIKQVSAPLFPNWKIDTVQKKEKHTPPFPHHKNRWLRYAGFPREHITTLTHFTICFGNQSFLSMYIIWAWFYPLLCVLLNIVPTKGVKEFQLRLAQHFLNKTVGWLQ